MAQIAHSALSVLPYLVLQACQLLQPQTGCSASTEPCAGGWERPSYLAADLWNDPAVGRSHCDSTCKLRAAAAGDSEALTLAQVVGSAIAISLLTYGAIPLWAGVIVTAIASFVLLLLERLGVRWLEALFAVLIGVMGLSFGIMYVLAGVPTVRVLEGKLLLILLCMDRSKTEQLPG